MTQAIGIVGIFVPGDDLVKALPQQTQAIMLNPVVLTGIVEPLGPVAGQMVARWSKARKGSRPASLVIWPPEKSARMGL